MPIKVAPRTTVSEDFVRAFKEISTKRMAAIQEYQNRLPDYMKKRTQASNTHIMQRLDGIVNGKHLDFELTKLRTLEYTSFEVVVHIARDGTKVPYLVGTTKDILIKNGRDNWLMGPYGVCLPMKALINGQSDGFQMYPHFAPSTEYRHPHHHTSDGYTNPLDHRPYTCWGGFGAIVTSCVQDCDIPELFRSIHTYLGRYNAGSPLVRIENINFKRPAK